MEREEKLYKFLITVSHCLVVINLGMELTIIYLRNLECPGIVDSSYIFNWLIRSQIWNFSIQFIQIFLLRIVKNRWSFLRPYIIFFSTVAICTVISSQHYHFAGTQFTFIIPIFLSLLVMNTRITVFTELLSACGFANAVVFRIRANVRMDTLLADTIISFVTLCTFGVIAINLVRFLVNQKSQTMEAKKEAELANSAKTDFLSNMSHEIRTPINSILGMNEMILRESENQQISGYARNINVAGNALLSLINDILDISKIESGKFKIVESEYSIKSFVQDCHSIILPRFSAKNLEFKVVFDPMLPSFLRGDEVRIRQVVMNFLTNSAKYTKSGSVTFSVSGKRENGIFELVLSVKDTGIGISDENLKKLFEPFERLDLKENVSIEGTGLGLKISRELAELMNGSITVKSSLGEGSEFVFTVSQKIVDATPVGKVDFGHEEKNTGKAKYHVSFTSPRARILVVDDIAMNILVFRHLLRDTKIQIDSTLSADDCFEKACENEYDILFIDHMMPGTSGIELYKKICENERSKNRCTPAVMLTANALAGSREKYLSVGFTDYLSKPVLGKDLEAVIRKLLSPDLICNNEGTELEEWYRSFDKESDYAEAVKNSGGTEDMLRSLLEKYVEDNFIEKLEKEFLAENWDQYSIFAHSLKGVSRTLGFKSLGNDAFGLEVGAKAGNADFIRSHHREVIDNYRALIGKIKGMLKTSDS